MVTVIRITWVAMLMYALPMYASEKIKVTFLGSQYPNYEYKNKETGKIEGSTVELLALACEKAGFECTQEITRWSIATQRAIYEENVGVHSMVRTPQREDNYQWVGPVYVDQLLLVTRRDYNINPSLLMNVVGTQVGFYSVPILQSAGFIVKQYKDYGQIFKALDAREIDLVELMFSQRKTILEMWNQDPKDFKRVHTLGEKFGVYVAFSTETSKKVVDGLQNALNAIKANGEDVAIYKKYGLWNGS